MIRKYTNLTFFSLLAMLAVGLESGVEGLVGFAISWLVLLAPVFLPVWILQFGGWVAEHF